MQRIVITPCEFKSEVQRLPNSRAEKDFAGCSPVQALPWSIIELDDGGCKLLAGDFIEISILGKILAQEAVGVFIGAAFPTAVGMRKVNPGT